MKAIACAIMVGVILFKGAPETGEPVVDAINRALAVLWFVSFFGFTIYFLVKE